MPNASSSPLIIWPQRLNLAGRRFQARPYKKLLITSNQEILTSLGLMFMRWLTTPWVFLRAQLKRSKTLSKITARSALMFRIFPAGLRLVLIIGSRTRQDLILTRL